MRWLGENLLLNVFDKQEVKKHCCHQTMLMTDGNARE